MMLYVVVIIVLAMYWKIKNQYILRLTIKYQYRLFDLRDKLRNLALDGKIDRNSWMFGYLDGSISKTVHELVSINLFSAAFLASIYRKDKAFLGHRALINSEIVKNDYAKFIFDEYGDLIFHYVINKHFILKGLIFCLMISHHLMDKIKQDLGNFRIVPETSKAYDVDTDHFAYHYNVMK